MSKIRFEAARQYIQEGDYDKAREILETMTDNPAAQKWLAKLDEIDPPFPEVELSQSRLFVSTSSREKEKRMPQSQGRNAALDEEVQKAQRVGRIGGSFILLVGVGLILFMLVANPLKNMASQYISDSFTTSLHLITAVFVGVGFLILCSGLYQIWYAGRADKIRANLVKGKAKNVKKSGLMFLGIAVMFAFVGIFTKQTSQFGFSILWGILGGIMLLYQLPKAEEFDRQQGLSQNGDKAKRSDW